MRRGSIRKAYKYGLIEPLARSIDRRETERQPYSRNTRNSKEWHAFVDRMLKEARDRLFHVKGAGQLPLPSGNGSKEGEANLGLRN